MTSSHDANRRKEDWQKLYENVPDGLIEKVLLRTENYDRIGPIVLPLKTRDHGILDFMIYYYGFYVSGESYFLITRSTALEFTNPLVRISSNCNWAFDLDSVRCDCDWEFQYSKARIAAQANHDGLIIFAIDHHGKSIPGGTRGHALIYALGQAQRQDLVHDAYLMNGFDLDYRKYDDVCIILRDLGIKRVRLLTNNPDRIERLTQCGFVAQREPIEKPYEKYDSEELGVKRERLSHYLTLESFNQDDVRIYGLDPSEVFRPKRDERGR